MTLQERLRESADNWELERVTRYKAADRIDQLEAALAVAKDALEDWTNPCGCMAGCEFCTGGNEAPSLEEALAKINEVMGVE